MSAIAYITDSKMLELHRLNNHRTMNFWRLSNNINFSDFHIGDLVFFLSKDKEHMKNKEKGIVGFGRLKHIHLNTIKYMWDKYGDLNGYNTYDEFKEAVTKVAKEKTTPKRISSFYLENVTFFQPIYLSECDLSISSNIESYFYLKPDEVVLKLLNFAQKSIDAWSIVNLEESVDKEMVQYALYATHNRIGEMINDEKIEAKAKKSLRKHIEKDKELSFIQASGFELYKISCHNIIVVLYHDRNVNERLLLGQAQLYRHYIKHYYNNPVVFTFMTSDNDLLIEYQLNNI